MRSGPSPRAALALAALVALAALTALLWHRAAPPAPLLTPSASAPPTARRPPPPPAEARPRASVAGKVTEPGGAPALKAQVCAILSADNPLPSDRLGARPCAPVAPDGTYTLTGLLPGMVFRVSAFSPDFAPATYHDARGEAELRLAEAEARAGVDLALEGGVRIKGRVNDVMGGVIRGAVVHGSSRQHEGQSMAISGEGGDFTMVLAPGPISLEASAHGYTTAQIYGDAPNDTIAIHLTAGATLVGRTVEAGKDTPVAGARVQAYVMEGSNSGGSTLSDDEGKFRIEGLAPGRYRIEAMAEGRQGYSQRSVTLAVGEPSAEQRIEMDPAFIVEGRVLEEGSDTPCQKGSVTITDHDQNEYSTARIQPDGSVRMASVIPGSYEVEVDCDERLAPKTLPLLRIDRADPPPQLWRVGRGESLRVRVLDDERKPLVGARIQVQSEDPGAGFHRSARTGADGSALLAGLSTGSYRVEASHLGNEAEPHIATVERGREAAAEIEIKKSARGFIEGSVVDGDGKPVGGVRVSIAGKIYDSIQSREDGSFRSRSLPPGDYTVRHDEQWRGEKLPTVEVTASKTARVTLTVARRDGEISGRVVDSHGEPVTDAFLSWRKTSGPGSAHLRQQAPVITDTDGRFTLVKLAAGSYEVKASRRGAGEARAENVATGTRDLTLRIGLGASIRGTLTDPQGKPVERYTLSVSETNGRFSRQEHFFHSPAFSLSDLPAGDYVVTASNPTGVAETRLKLAEGEARQGLALQLTGRGRVEGRLVKLEGGAPVTGYRLMLDSETRGNVLKRGSDNETDEAGRFAIDGVLAGKLRLILMPRDGHLPSVTIPFAVDEGRTTQLGDIPIAEPRMKPGDTPGILGYSLKHGDDGTLDLADRIELRSVFGPGARAGLQVGDIIVSVDGHDVRGPRSYLYHPLTTVAAGRTLQLGLARGATVALLTISPKELQESPAP